MSVKKCKECGSTHYIQRELDDLVDSSYCWMCGTEREEDDKA